MMKKKIVWKNESEMGTMSEWVSESMGEKEIERMRERKVRYDDDVIYLLFFYFYI